MLLNRVKKEMSLKEIDKETDDIIRCNKLHWFLKRKLIIGTIIAIITYLFAIMIKAGAYKILNIQMPIFRILIIIYGVASIAMLLVALAIREIKLEKEKYFHKWAYIYDLYNFFMICICILLLLMTYLFAFVRVSGPSMKPTYKNNDILACRSIGYKPKKNDCVIINMKNVETVNTNELYVKRIVAIPGDTVTYDEINMTISVNGEIIEANYAYWRYLKWNNHSNSITLGDKEYFVMGDNRGDSTDSRYFGPVKKSDIAGKAMFDLFFWR